MELSESKIPLLNLRVVDNALTYVKGNLLQSFAHTGTGEYAITLSDDVDFDEMNVRVTLFGNPVASD